MSIRNISIFFFSFFYNCLLQAQSKYDSKEAFAPQFYTTNGNEYRNGSGEPGPKYWQNRADYTIDCILDTSKHSIRGKMTLTYTNNSPDNLKFLWLQTEQNAYRNDSRATRVYKNGSRWKNTDFTDGYTINTILIEGRGKKYTPKYNVSDTRTQVWLQKPLKGNGGKIKFSIDYSFIIPKKGSDRMGRMHTKNGWLYEIAQWFPRMAVYDDINGWDLLPCLGQGGFYLEYGDINFNVTAPADMIVVGSGELQNPSECFTVSEAKKYKEAKNSDKTVMIRSIADIKNLATGGKKGTNTWKFKIQNTRDVAWAASRAFILDGAKINLSKGKKSLALSAYPQESDTAIGWQRSTEMVKNVMEFYSKYLCDFAYPTAINVAGTVTGWEYPGIVFCGYKLKDTALWKTTNHELGHNWFPMIVGSNERKYAWMDEGFDYFINELCTQAYNNGEFNKKNMLENISSISLFMLFKPSLEPLLTATDVLDEKQQYYAAYYKPAVMLHMLRELVLGSDRFDGAFREYFNRWAFKHPTPQDFFRTIENVGGEDLGWFWRSWVYNNWELDQSVKSVKYKDSLGIEGATINIENLGKMPMPVEVQIKENNGKRHQIKLPVEVWQHGSSHSFQVPTTSLITEVIIDPGNRLPDRNRANNTWGK